MNVSQRSRKINFSGVIKWIYDKHFLGLANFIYLIDRVKWDEDDTEKWS